MSSCEILFQSHDILGECPVPVPSEDAIYWIDIERCLLQRLQLSTRTHTQWTLPEKIGSFGFQGEKLVVALASGLYHFDLETEALDPLFRLPAGMPLRFNDGKCDPQGRFWAGSMHRDGAEKIGALYCLGLDGICRMMLDGLGIPNGLAWSPDSRTMYMADSFDRTIYAYPFDPARGTLGEARVFFDSSVWPGLPDGAATDAEGFYWSAHCNGRALIRYAPDGSAPYRIPLPVQYPTSCAFSPGADELYVTTAIWDLSEEECRVRQPMAGALLRVPVHDAFRLAQK